MAIGHVAVRCHSRAEGHTVSASVRYRTGTSGTCPRTGVKHDFSHRLDRHEVVARGIEASRQTPFGASTEAFIAAVEGGEMRSNARVWYDVQVGLPHGLGEDIQTKLVSKFGAALAGRYDTVTLWSVHRADRSRDERGTHGHIVLPTRELAEDGKALGKKERALDGRRGSEEIRAIRNLWLKISRRPG